MVIATPMGSARAELRSLAQLRLAIWRAAILRSGAPPRRSVGEVSREHRMAHFCGAREEETAKPLPVQRKQPRARQQPQPRPRRATARSAWTVETLFDQSDSCPGTWCTGTVRDYVAECKHLIVYDDGDQQWLT